jgi:hypothetical protein
VWDYQLVLFIDHGFLAPGLDAECPEGDEMVWSSIVLFLLCDVRMTGIRRPHTFVVS